MKIDNLVFCWNENTHLVPIFVLSVQYTLDGYRSICPAIKYPLEITADDYLVTSKGAVYDANPAAYIVLRIIDFNVFHAYQVHVPSFCLLPFVYLTVCFMCLYVRAYN